MGPRRQRIGRQGEDLAVEHLERRGWQVIARNWRCRSGEIDLIARDPAGTTVFCEVKTRTGRGFGGPLEAITWDKERRLRQLAGAWLADHPGGAGIRIDAIGVLLQDGREPRITHVEGI